MCHRVKIEGGGDGFLNCVAFRIKHCVPKGFGVFIWPELFVGDMVLNHEFLQSRAEECATIVQCGFWIVLYAENTCDKTAVALLQTMQDDITDGVMWLIDKEYVDRNRIAIYGGSYGGYATLQALVKTPELFACGVDYVGVSNLFTFLNTIPPYWKPMLEMMYEQVGNPETDKEMLTANSPALNAEKIVRPLFIAQGANDPRVNKAESDQMVEALRKRGVKVEYMVKDNEGHGFHNEENRFEFYHAMEDFLSKWLNANK